jgi:hypothetical protein
VVVERAGDTADRLHLSERKGLRLALAGVVPHPDHPAAGWPSEQVAGGVVGAAMLAPVVTTQISANGCVWSSSDRMQAAIAAGSSL